MRFVYYYHFIFYIVTKVGMRLYGSKDTINTFFIEHTGEASLLKLFKSVVYLDTILSFQSFDDFSHWLILKNINILL